MAMTNRPLRLRMSRLTRLTLQLPDGFVGKVRLRCSAYAVDVDGKEVDSNAKEKEIIIAVGA